MYLSFVQFEGAHLVFLNQKSQIQVERSSYLLSCLLYLQCIK